MKIRSGDYILLGLGILAIIGAIARLVVYKGTNNSIASGVIFIVGIYIIYKVYERAKTDKDKGEDE